MILRKIGIVLIRIISLKIIMKMRKICSHLNHHLDQCISITVHSSALLSSWQHSHHNANPTILYILTPIKIKAKDRCPGTCQDKHKDRDKGKDKDKDRGKDRDRDRDREYSRTTKKETNKQWFLYINLDLVLTMVMLVNKINTLISQYSGMPNFVELQSVDTYIFFNLLFAF